MYTGTPSTRGVRKLQFVRVCSVGHEIYFVHESAQREYSTNTHEDGIAIFRNSMENEGIFLNGYNQ